MPIEIKELIIRTHIQEQPPANSGQNQTASGNSPKINQQKVVQECVEQVMRLLKDHQER